MCIRDRVIPSAENVTNIVNFNNGDKDIKEKHRTSLHHIEFMITLGDSDGFKGRL